MNTLTDYEGMNGGLMMDWWWVMVGDGGVEWWMMMNDDEWWWMMMNDDEWWMMNDEWWMMNDEWWMMKIKSIKKIWDNYNTDHEGSGDKKMYKNHHHHYELIDGLSNISNLKKKIFNLNGEDYVC